MLTIKKVVTKTNISLLTAKALDLVKPTFDKHKIIVIKQIEDFDFLSLENELIQVFMNIFVNAKDALKDNIEENKKRLFKKIQAATASVSLSGSNCCLRKWYINCRTMMPSLSA